MKRETFGTKMRNWRRAANLTQDEAALKLGLGSAQFISNIERNLCWLPLNMCKPVAKIYKLNPKKLGIEMLAFKSEQLLREAGL